MLRSRTRFRCILLLLLGVGMTGCAGILRPFRLAPSGLTRGDDQLRSELAAGRFQDALDGVGPGQSKAPKDELLRLLYEGIVLHYAGQYRESSSALDQAAQLAEDRFTRSISREALSLATNDLVLAYRPGQTERLLIHYYSALNYLEWQDIDGAAVEARRLSLLLQRQEEDGDERREIRQRSALLRYFAGTVFDAAGEANDADVAYRNAYSLIDGNAPSATELGPVRSGNGGGASAGTLPTGDSLGEVVVVVERGFVAHRVEQSLLIPLFQREIDSLHEAKTAERLAWAGVLAGAVLASGSLGPPEVHRGRARGTRRISRGPGRTGYLLKVAWPAYRRDQLDHAPVSVVATDGEAVPVQFAADLSGAVIADFERSRTGVLTRAIARAAIKYLLSERAGRQKDEDEDDDDDGDDNTAAKVAGALVNIGGVLLEQADTRSWHLLPGEIGLARLRLPVGQQAVTLRMGGGTGKTIDLGTVNVRLGEVAFVSTRVWD